MTRCRTYLCSSPFPSASSPRSSQLRLWQTKKERHGQKLSFWWCKRLTIDKKPPFWSKTELSVYWELPKNCNGVRTVPLQRHLPLWGGAKMSALTETTSTTLWFCLSSVLAIWEISRRSQKLKEWIRKWPPSPLRDVNSLPTLDCIFGVRRNQSRESSLHLPQQYLWQPKKKNTDKNWVFGDTSTWQLTWTLILTQTELHQFYCMA